MDPIIPKQTHRVSWGALDRYLAGEASAAEAVEVEAYLGQQQGAAESLRAAEVILGPQAARAGQALTWERIEAQLASEAGDTGRPNHRVGTGIKPPPTRRKYQWPWVAVVAGTVAAIAVAFMTLTPDDRASMSAAPDAQTYVTAEGERATVELARGSRATLAPATTVSVRHSGREISVAVSGEALFEVQPDSRIPFVVHTPKSVTRVLGTTFVVREYQNDHSARIVVADGRVAVQVARDSVMNGTPNSAQVGTHSVLTAASLATVDDSGQVKVIPNVTVDAYIGVAKGRLMFQKTRARDVVVDLSRAYAVKITIADSALADVPVNWKVETAKFPLSQVLPELLMMLNAHTKQTENGFTIVPGRTSVRATPAKQSSPTFNREAQYGR